MSDKELGYLDELVSKAFNGYISDGDQDRELLRQMDFTSDEIATLSYEFAVFNGEPEEYDPTWFLRLPECSVASFLYFKLREHLKKVGNNVNNDS